MDDEEMTPTERVGVVVWLLSGGHVFTTPEVAKISGLTTQGAWLMLSKLSRKLPLVNVNDYWKLTDEEGRPLNRLTHKLTIKQHAEFAELLKIFRNELLDQHDMLAGAYGVKDRAVHSLERLVFSGGIIDKIRFGLDTHFWREYPNQKSPYTGWEYSPPKPKGK